MLFVKESALLTYTEIAQGVITFHTRRSSISTRGVEFLKENAARELARWTAAIDTLLMPGYIKCIGIKNKIYAVTNEGYTFTDQIKEEFNIDTSKDFGEYLVD